VASARETVARAKVRAQQAEQRINELRPAVPALNVAMTARERDRGLGGSVLAGALAFRLFVPLMPGALLIVTILGFLSSEDPKAPAEIANKIGMSGQALTSIAESAKLSHGAQLSVIAFALFALVTSSLSAVRALRAIHALAWGMPLRRFPRALSAALVFIGWFFAFFALWALGGWARSSLGPAGLPVTLALTAAFLALWIAVSKMLPHPPELPWRAFLPGAVLVAVGIEAIHVATVLYISKKAQEASATYGALGLALVLLTWLYLLGRLIVASAFLNVSVWHQDHPPPQHPG